MPARTAPAATATDPAAAPTDPPAQVTPAPVAVSPPAGTCIEAGIEMDGVQGMRYCGPARVEGTINGEPFAISEGNCLVTPHSVSVQIGTAVWGEVTAPPDSFVLFVGATGMGDDEEPASTDGQYEAHASFLTYGGDAHSIFPVAVTLTDGRTRGEFEGPFDIGEGEATGTWTCQ